MKERRMSLALPAGTVLCRGGDRYVLEKVTGLGGSCLFYAAKKEGSALPFGIKECCPAFLAEQLCRRGGIVAGAAGRAQRALDEMRERMRKEAEASQRVATLSARTIPVWEAPGEVLVETAEGAIPAPAGSFLILRDLTRVGMFLPRLLEELAPSAGGRIGLHTIVCILEEVLLAVDLVHRAGYLYSDVQPENIFFAAPRPEAGEVGFACLLDFGCARPLQPRKGGGEETAPIEDRMIFSTPGYTAPEIAWDNDGTLRLTPAADLYSVGRLLLWLLRGRTYVEKGRDRLLGEGLVLTRILPAEGERLGCTRESLRQLQTLLDWSLCLDPDNRYQTAREMLEDVEKLKALTRPPKNQLALSYSALPEGMFLPREEKLAELDRALRRGPKPAVLWGFAGMGKTELAIQFADGYTRGRAHFIRFRSSARETVTGPIADAFSGYDRMDVRGREKPEEQIYREVMDLLREQGENDLLILDNMDGDEGGFDVLRGEPAFRDLCALRMGLLVTTRSPVEGGVEADTLPLPLLRQLLRRGAPELSDEMADALIRAVEGHTLTVDLMGRTLKTSIPRLRPEVLLEKLTRGDLDSKALAKVSSPKDREGRMERIQGHLTALFRLSDLPEEEKRMLSYALPISPEGLDAEDFARIPGFDQDVLLRLIDRGWIRRSGDDVLTMHPLVQETGWRELKPDLWDLYILPYAVGMLSATHYDDSAQTLERRLGYAEELFHHGTEPAVRVVVEGDIWTFLYLLGRHRQALEGTETLLKEVEKGGYGPAYLYEALEHYAIALESVGEEEKAAACRRRLEEMGPQEPLLPEGLTKRMVDNLSDSDLGMVARINRLHEAKGGEDREKLIRFYEESRSWFLERGLNTAHLDFEMSSIYGAWGERENECLMLKRACTAMEAWRRPTYFQTGTLLALAKSCADLGRMEEGRPLMLRALEVQGRLFEDERKRSLLDFGKDAVELARSAGWTEEAAAWEKALEEGLSTGREE